MNKTELVAAIAERTELTKKDADQALKAFIDVVCDELSKGEKIQLAGFATVRRLIKRETFKNLSSLIMSSRTMTFKHDLINKISYLLSLLKTS